MNIYEKEIAKRQMIEPAFSYPYKLILLSEKAKFNIALYLKKTNKDFSHSPTRRSEIMKLVTAEKLNQAPFVGQRTFYYDESLEDKTETSALTRDFALVQLALAEIPSFNHMGTFKKHVHLLEERLVEGEDYKIEIGEKIIHEQPKLLTFDDINPL